MMEEGEYYDGWCLIPCNSDNSMNKINTGNEENTYINPSAESQAKEVNLITENKTKEVNLITENQTSDANNPITDRHIKEANLITEDQTNDGNPITEYHPKEANLIIEDQLSDANSILEDQTSHTSCITKNQTTDDFITKSQTNYVNHFTIDQTNENFESTSSSSIAVIEEEEVSPWSYKNDVTSSFTTARSSNMKKGIALLSRNIESLRNQADQSMSNLQTTLSLERPYINHPNIPGKLFPQVVNVSTNTEPQVNQRKLDGNSNEQNNIERTMKKNTENCKLQKKIHNKKENCHLNLPSINDDDCICLCFMTLLILCGIIILTISINISMKTSHNLQQFKKITNLQMENNLLKKHMFYSEKKENRKLSSMSRVFYDKLEKRENVSKYLELESSYQKEIDQLKQQVSSLKANYTILQSHLTPGISANMQDVIKEKAQFYIDTNINLKRFSELIILLSRQMNDGGYKSEIDCIGDFVKKTVSSVKSVLTKYSLSDDLKFIKNYISEKGYISLFSEFMNGLHFVDSPKLKEIQQIFDCIKEASKIREYKSKIEKIKVNFNHLLGELEELKES